MRPLDVLREEWRVKASEWAEAHDLAERYDEGRKILLDKLTLALMEGEAGLSVARAEREARTSAQFTTYVRNMYDAKRKAQDARIAMQLADRIYYEQVGAEAQSRAEMRMTGAER